MAKILLVEDDNNLREIYEARMQAEGYDIVSAMDGEEALVVAKKEKPDLIISDVMMARISGFEMLDILRNTEELKHVKVIMLTALGQAEDKTRADQLGADRYLVKSQVTLEDIVKTAQELLGSTDTPAPSTPATAAAAAELAQTPPTTTTPASVPTPAAPTTTPPVATTNPTPPDSPATPPPATEPPQPAPEPPVNVTPTPADDTTPAAIPEPTNPTAAPTPSPAIAPTAVAPPAADAPTIVTPSPAPTSDDTTTDSAQTPANDGQPQPAAGAQTTSEETATMNAQIADFVSQGTPAQTSAGPVAPTAADPGISTPSQETEQPKEEVPAPPTMNQAQADAVISDALKNLVGGQPAPADNTASPTTEPATAPPIETPGAPTSATNPEPTPAPTTPTPTEPTPPVTDAPVAPPPDTPEPEPSAPPAPPEVPTNPMPAVAQTPEPEAPSNPAASAPPVSAGDNVTISGKKIIRPITPTNDGSTPSNLQDLLTKEGFGSLDDEHPANPGGSVVNADGTHAQPHPPGHVIAPGANTANNSGVDPNSIAL